MLHIKNTGIATIANQSKFERGRTLAAGVKHQKYCLAMARVLIAKKQIKLAKLWLAEWAKQRKAQRIATLWQAPDEAAQGVEFYPYGKEA